MLQPPQGLFQRTKTPGIDPHHGQILRDRIGLLYKSQGASLGLSLAVATILFAVHANYHSVEDNENGWLAIICLVLGLRMLCFRAFQRRDKGTPTFWLNLYRAGALLTAWCWGAAGVVFFAPHDAVLQAFSVLVIGGVSAGALGELAADYPTYRGFVALSLLPAALVAMSKMNQTQVAIGLLVILLGLFLLRSGRRTAQSLTDSLRLRYENADLVKALEQEQKRLVSNAETMMNTVLSSAPIALWAIDMNGNVTYMESRRLNRLTDIAMPKVGDNLLEFFAGVPQILRQTRRVLHGDAFVAEVDLGDYVYEVHYSPLRNDGGEQTGAIGVAIDISERKHHEQELLHRANYDNLTELPNRVLAMEILGQAFARARRTGTSVAIYFLDLDNFKSINDTLGHRAGDVLLCEAAARLQQCLRDSDFAARISGDEFLVIAEDLHQEKDAETLAYKLVNKFHQPFDLDGRHLFTTTSIGIAIYPRDGDSTDQLLQCADTAMYTAKESGKNSYRFFTAQMQNRAMRHLAIETEIRHALRRNELTLYYQPKIDIQKQCICGAEVLLRWHSKELGAVSPEEFIPVAEMAGLMPEIGDWVLRTACREAAQWPALVDRPINIAINISPQQFRKTDLLANVTQAMVESGLPSSALELEITESLLVQDAPSVIRTFHSLNEMGLTLALDDFGTGYSSLSYLRKFPLQVLKIDKSFIQDLGEERDSEALVYAIIAMARSLHMQVVAEGVETQRQLDYLQARGVELVQGFLFSAPVPAPRFREMLLNPEPCHLLKEHYAKQEARPEARSG
jgi:diguanylate cyclase (GGDEF)-like protein